VGGSVGVVELAQVRCEAHAVRDADPLQQHSVGQVRFEPVEPAAKVLLLARVEARRDRAAEDAPAWIGDDVVEAGRTLGRNLLDQRGQGAIAPGGDLATLHEQEQRAVLLDREAADLPAGVDLFVLTGGRIVAEQAAGDDVGPVDPLLILVPEGAFPHDALVVGDQLRLHGALPVVHHSSAHTCKTVRYMVALRRGRERAVTALVKADNLDVGRDLVMLGGDRWRRMS
jgi:hypothetical protein